MESQIENDSKNPLKKSKGLGAGLNLIPEIAEEEKVKIEKKETFTLSTAVFIFLVMLFTVSLLLFNFSLRNQNAVTEKSINLVEAKLTSSRERELKIKNIVNKYNAVHDLKKEDLQYFFLTEEVSNFPTSVRVKNISLDSDNMFRMSGLALSKSAFSGFIQGLEKNEVFGDVNIEVMEVLTDEQQEKAKTYKEDSYTINWRLSGYFYKDISKGEVIQQYEDL